MSTLYGDHLVRITNIDWGVDGKLRPVGCSAQTAQVTGSRHIITTM